MILHLYLNEKRLKDISIQLSSKLNPDETKTIDKEININGEISGGIPSWLEYLGFKGQGKIGSQGKIAISKEIKPLSLEFALLKIFKEKIIKNDFNHLTPKTKFNEIKRGNDLVRIQGKFEIQVKGINSLERVSNFESLPYVEWVGDFYDFQVILSSSKESYTGRTPIFQCLSSPEQILEMEVLGVITSISGMSNQDRNVVRVLPIYFGVDLDF